MTSIEEQVKLSQFSERELSQIRDIISEVPCIEEVILFGSRAKGCADRGSDVDLVVKGRAITEEKIFRLYEKLSEESNLPYFFDVVDYASLEDGPLKAHIDRVGLTLYERADTIDRW